MSPHGHNQGIDAPMMPNEKGLIPHASMRPSSDGFTLIELMIAMVVSLMLLLALTALYLNVSRGNHEMAKASGVIENGRFALQFLQDDLVHSGYWDIYVPPFDDLTDSTASGSTVSNPPTAVPDPCLTYASWDAEYKNNLLSLPVQAYDAAPSGCSSVVTNQVASTDVLVARHADTCVPGVGSCESDTAGKLYFQASTCSGEASYILDTAGFTLHTRGCTTLAIKRKFVSSIYYIRDYADRAGDGIPTLVRSQFDLQCADPSDPTTCTLAQQAAVPLVEGIQALRVEVGIDDKSRSGTDVITDATTPLLYQKGITWHDAATKDYPTSRGDGAPDTYIHCTTSAPCSVDQLANAVAVKLYLLVRSRDATAGYTDTKTYTLGGLSLGPFNDGYKRHLFITTVRFNSKSGRRYSP